MPTTKQRILVTLMPDMANDIAAIAKREKSPRATVAARLVRQALEDEEDRYLSAVGDAAVAHAGTLLSSDDFWNRVAELREARRD